MSEVFICDAIRTPIGRYGGPWPPSAPTISAALPLKALMERNPGVDWGAVDDVVYGCANQAGEDNRNVARMALLLAGLPKEVPGSTVNRLCGSSLDALSVASRAIKSGEAELMIVGRRRKHVARALRHGQGRCRLQPQRRNLRHHHRLALRQPRHEGPVRRRFHARNRRKRRRGVPRQSRRSGRLLLSHPAALGPARTRPVSSAPKSSR